MHQYLAVLRGRVKRYALVMSCTSIVIIFGFKSLINLFLIENIILIDVNSSCIRLFYLNFHVFLLPVYWVVNVSFGEFIY